MKKISAIVLLFLCLSISFFHFAFAAEGPKPAAQLQAQAAEKAKLAAQAQAAEIDNLKTRIAVLKETNGLQREVDALKSQFEAHDKYIDRIIAFMGVAVTLLTVIIGFLSWQTRQEAKEAANEAKKEAAELHQETLRIHDEAKTKLEKVDEMHDQIKQKSTDMLELAKNMEAIEMEITESGKKPSAEIINGLQKEFDKFSNDIATTLSKASSEKEKISKSLEKELSAAKEVAKFLKKQDKPLPASHYFSLGYEEHKKGNHEEAILQYSKAIELKPDFGYAYNNRGVAKDDMGAYKEAIADYDKAIELKPDDAFAYNNRGAAKNNLGRNEEAIADYDRAIVLKPDHADVYNNRGNAKGNQGRYEEAIADYDKAIKLKPDFVGVYNGKAEALICLLRYGDAEITIVTNAARFIEDEDKVSALYLLRLALAAQGKDDGKAKTDYETLLKNNSGLNFKGWDHKPIEKKLAEIEQKKELPSDRIEKMKAIHAEFKTLAK